MDEEVDQLVGRDAEGKTFEDRRAGAGDRHDLPPRVEDRAAAVAGIDGGVGLDEPHLVDCSRRAADDPLGDAPLEACRVADREHQIADPEVVAIVEHHRLGQLALRLVGIELQDCQVTERLERDDPDLAKLVLLEALVGFAEQRDLEPRVVFDDVVVGHEVTIATDQKAGAQAAWIPHHHHRLAEPFDQFRHLAGLEPCRAEDVVLVVAVDRHRRLLGPHVEQFLGRNLQHVEAEVEDDPVVVAPQQRRRHPAAADQRRGHHLAGRRRAGPGHRHQRSAHPSGLHRCSSSLPR